MERTEVDLSATVYATIGEVTTLTTRSEKVAETFKDIEVGLSDVDRINPPHFDDDWNPVECLQPTWIKYQVRFTDLCSLSSYNAGLAQKKTRDFSESVLPCVLSETAAIVDKFDTLTHFKFECENPINIPVDLVEEIATLQQDILTFSTSTNLTDHMSDQLGADIQLLLSEIEAGILGSISGLSWIWSLAKIHATFLGDSDLERIGSDEFLKARIEGMNSAYKILEGALQDYTLRIATLTL